MLYIIPYYTILLYQAILYYILPERTPNLQKEVRLAGSHRPGLLGVPPTRGSLLPLGGLAPAPNMISIVKTNIKEILHTYICI